jgi:excisionase family DNA binding protein
VTPCKGRNIYVAQRLFVRRCEQDQTTPEEEALTLSVEHAARLIGVSRATVYRMVRDGELRAVRVGRRVLVLKKPLMEMLEAEEDTNRL